MKTRKLVIMSMGLVVLGMGAGAWAVQPGGPHRGSMAGSAHRPAAAPAFSQPAMPRGSSQPGGGNFGQIVSVEAKVFRDTPLPGFDNFGQWVSSQRRHQPERPPGNPVKTPKKRTGPDAGAPTPGAPDAPTSDPVAPTADPTQPTYYGPSLPESDPQSGSNGT